MPLSKFISTLHDEVSELHGETRNFTSLLRCACLVHLERNAAGRVAEPVKPARRIAASNDLRIAS